ncbi:MAG: ABC transporter permease [Lachnospiraceae bacterium]|jgi:peptide/nickel transport system permease protein|nr:ABC transporter permease [Lachnospiraceae bacterium]
MRTSPFFRGKTSRRFLFFLVLAGLLLCLAALAPAMAPNDPAKTHMQAIKQAPCAEFPLGTDEYGRCVLSRVLSGAPVSVFGAACLVAVSFLVGTFLGMLCGYYEGILDEAVMRLADVLLAFPQMVLAIAVAGLLGGGLKNALLALGITSWTVYARLARSLTLQAKKETYVAAARFSGCGGTALLFRHIFPNVAGPMVVTAATQIGSTMMGIAGLSFLGIGVIPPQAEWGSMISEGRSYMQLAPWVSLAPAAAIVVTVVVFNCLGDAARDLAEPGTQAGGKFARRFRLPGWGDKPDGRGKV